MRSATRVPRTTSPQVGRESENERGIMQIGAISTADVLACSPSGRRCRRTAARVWASMPRSGRTCSSWRWSALWRVGRRAGPSTRSAAPVSRGTCTSTPG
eukprot:scaffold20361_cov102-Isochrysis_galbana.AAC.14